MKTKLLIIGAGNVGGFISYNVALFGAYEILGFLDDDPSKTGTTLYGRKVLGTVASIDDYIQDEPISVVIGIANPVHRRRIVKFLSTKNVLFPSLIASNCWVSAQVEIGKGVILYPGISINYECSIDDFCIINMNCAIGHNCDIGKYATLAPGVNLAGFTKIEKCTDVGIGATTIQGVTIGSNSRVGGQSMIIKDVPENSVVVGNPARVIRTQDQI